jgi:hypothetical protein
LARYSAIAAYKQARDRQAALDAAYSTFVHAAFAQGSPSRARFDAAVLSMKTEIEAAGSKFAVAIFPLLNGLDGSYPFAKVHRDLGAFFESEGIQYQDLLPAFQGHGARSLWVHPTDQHPNVEGHAIAAKALEQLLAPLL